MSNKPSRAGWLVLQYAARGGEHAGISENFLCFALRLQNLDGFPETQGMHDFPLSQKLQAILKIHIICQINQPLVCSPGFFLSGNILIEIRDWIAFVSLTHNKSSKPDHFKFPVP
jgi:hypothetical protein